MKKIRKQIEKILGVEYLAPHAPPPGKEFKGADRTCGDCFCTIQEVHTHNGIEEETLNQLVKLFEEYKG